jgi:superfamily II DNA/RNA helicase
LCSRHYDETGKLTTISFTDLKLAPEILKALTESGYTTPTPIQAQAIPLVLEGSDLMAGAQTGTGKTAAFALPMLQKLLPDASSSASPARHPVRALILVPTRELAIQVEESVKTYAKHTKLRSLVVFGGVDIKTQTPTLKRGVEILVATPGRLLDHIEMKSVQLNQVQVLVLDEADRMLDMGFMPDLKRILALLPKKRQNLMFSATFSTEIKKLSAEFLTKPRPRTLRKKSIWSSRRTSTCCSRNCCAAAMRRKYWCSPRPRSPPRALPGNYRKRELPPMRSMETRPSWNASRRWTLSRTDQSPC